MGWLLLVALGVSCRPELTPIGSPPREDSDAGATASASAPPPPQSPESGKVVSAGGPGAEATSPPERRTPSGYLLVSKERLAALRGTRSKADQVAFDALKANVDGLKGSTDDNNSSLDNIALMYLVTQQKPYAEQAWKWFKVHSADNVRRDSYYDFGMLMRGAALALNWCGDALSAEQKKELAEYLEKWTNELWFDNKGSGWGLKDPANNYYYSFVEGSAFAAYALKAANRPSAAKLVEHVHSKIDGPKGTLAYLESGAKGGDWEEGSNYALGSKIHMFTAFAAIASMGGPNYFAKTPFTNASLVYLAYETQPGRRVLAPMGDLARESSMSVSPFDRAYAQVATYWSDDPTARAVGSYVLKEVAPSFLMDTARLRYYLYRDVLFPTPEPMVRPTKLPLHYRSPGTDWVNARSSWDDNATSLTFRAIKLIDQSHAHFDSGAFVLFREDWQAADGNTYGHSGLDWESVAHNMITVKGQVHENGEKSRGLVQYGDNGKTMYAQIDSSNLLTGRSNPNEHGQPVLDEWTRELVYLRPSSLVVYDRVAPKAKGLEYSWNLHFPRKPDGEKGRYSATNGGGGMSVVVLDGGAQKVVQDSDVVDKGKSWRLELGPNPTGRFLAVIQVASGAAPSFTAEAISAQGIQGAAWGDQVVVVSSRPLGEPAPLPFTFTIKDGGPRQYTFANMKAGCDVSITKGSGGVTVRVNAGSKYAPNAQGVVQFTQ